MTSESPRSLGHVYRLYPLVKLDAASVQILGPQEALAGAVGADASARTAVFESSGDGGITILTPDASWGGFYFGSPANNKAAWLSYNQSSLIFGFEGPAGGEMVFND